MKFSENFNNQNPGLEPSTSLCNLLPSAYCYNSSGGRNILRIICGKYRNYLLVHKFGTNWVERYFFSPLWLTHMRVRNTIEKVRALTAF